MKYTFRKGKHRPTFSFPLPFFKKQMVIKAVFSPSCWYVDKDWERDWNKLKGFSLGFLPRKVDGKWMPAHHWKSRRIAWRPSLVEGLIEIALYQYWKGKLTITLFATCKVGEEFRYVLSSDRPGYTLSPFHGGTNPAQQDYTITLI